VEGIPIASPELRLAGSVLHLPDTAGVFVIACRFMGTTAHPLGAVLYVGVAEDMRRRVLSLLSGGKSGLHAPLRELHEAGGQVDVLYVEVKGAGKMPGLEAALVQEHMHRSGTKPAWNRGPARTKPSPEALATAEHILDALRILPR